MILNLEKKMCGIKAKVKIVENDLIKKQKGSYANNKLHIENWKR